jgi:hypothetical protein
MCFQLTASPCHHQPRYHIGSPVTPLSLDRACILFLNRGKCLTSDAPTPIINILTRQTAAAAYHRLCDGSQQGLSQAASLQTYSPSCASSILSPTAMGSPKHRLSVTESEGPDPKRLRVSDDSRQQSATDSSSRDDTSVTETAQGDDPAASALPHLSLPNLHAQSRQAIQRSIALVLRHDGFSSTTPEALESFTQLVETCKSRDRCWLSVQLHTSYGDIS